MVTSPLSLTAQSHCCCLPRQLQNIPYYIRPPGWRIPGAVTKQWLLLPHQSRISHAMPAILSLCGSWTTRAWAWALSASEHLEDSLGVGQETPFWTKTLESALCVVCASMGGQQGNADWFIAMGVLFVNRPAHSIEANCGFGISDARRQGREFGDSTWWKRKCPNT